MTAIQIGVVMGSSSDWDTMQHAVEILQHFGIPHEARVVSAHRMPDDMFAYAEAAAGRGLKAIIAGEHDNLPEQAFYMVAGIEEAVEKAKTLT